MVSDSGCGISEAEQATLFHRYAQARQGRQQTGSGLGLVICKELVALMQGRLEMVSRPGVGTTFTITLLGQGEPLRDPRAAGVARQTAGSTRAGDTDSGRSPHQLSYCSSASSALSAIASMKPATVKRQRISSPANITIC